MAASEMAGVRSYEAAVGLLLADGSIGSSTAEVYARFTSGGALQLSGEAVESLLYEKAQRASLRMPMPSLLYPDDDVRFSRAMIVRSAALVPVAKEIKSAGVRPIGLTLNAGRMCVTVAPAVSAAQQEAADPRSVLQDFDSEELSDGILSMYILRRFASVQQGRVIEHERRWPIGPRLAIDTYDKALEVDGNTVETPQSTVRVLSALALRLGQTVRHDDFVHLLGVANKWVVRSQVLSTRAFLRDHSLDDHRIQSVDATGYKLVLADDIPNA